MESSVRTASKLRIVVLGYIVRGPLGGFAWHHMQYVMGLVELGHDVYFIEDSSDSPWCCYDPSRHVTDSDPSFGLSFVSDAFDRVGLGERWAYYDAHTTQWWDHAQAGRSASAPPRSSDQRELGRCSASLAHGDPRRVFIDTDPAFTQIRFLTDPEERQRALHTRRSALSPRTLARWVVRSRMMAFPGKPRGSPLFSLRGPRRRSEGREVHHDHAMGKLPGARI